MRYTKFGEQRENRIANQEQVAAKEKEEYKKQMERYRRIYQRVDHEQRAISRQDPHGGQLLKKKMHSVKAMGKRFEKEKESMTKRPDYEESINVQFNDFPSIPN